MQLWRPDQFYVHVVENVTGHNSWVKWKTWFRKLTVSKYCRHLTVVFIFIVYNNVGIN